MISLSVLFLFVLLVISIYKGIYYKKLDNGFAIKSMDESINIKFVDD